MATPKKFVNLEKVSRGPRKFFAGILVWLMYSPLKQRRGAAAFFASPFQAALRTGSSLQRSNAEVGGPCAVIR
jgi:hypothetical protein